MKKARFQLTPTQAPPSPKNKSPTKNTQKGEKKRSFYEHAELEEKRKKEKSQSLDDGKSVAQSVASSAVSGKISQREEVLFEEIKEMKWDDDDYQQMEEFRNLPRAQLDIVLQSYTQKHEQYLNELSDIILEKMYDIE